LSANLIASHRRVIQGENEIEVSVGRRAAHAQVALIGNHCLGASCSP